MHGAVEDKVRNPASPALRVPFRAMACPCQIVLVEDDAGRAAAIAEQMQAEVLRIEAKYSRYREDSVVTRINAAAGSGVDVEVDDETAALLDYAATAWQQSGGLFDATAGVLRRVWNFREARCPSADQIAAVLPLIGWQRLRWRRPRIGLQRGMELDFGGFGKEYAADTAAALGLRAGIRGGFVDLGGDIRVLGPDRDGAPWRIGVHHPQRPGEAIATLELASGAIATSGDYERSFSIDGRRYGHVLNPHDGWPVQSFASVSVLAPQCLVAGTATTITMLKGCDEGGRWLGELGLPWLTVEQDGRMAMNKVTTGAMTDASR